MNNRNSNAPTSSTSIRGGVTLLLGLLLTALVFAPGCSQSKETTQQTETTQQPEAPSCTINNFEEDWSGLVSEQREREPHKALAYAKETNSKCFVWGYSYGFDSREAAIERALSECRSEKDKGENGTDRTYGDCTVHSVDGERQ